LLFSVLLGDGRALQLALDKRPAVTDSPLVGKIKGWKRTYELRTFDLAKKTVIDSRKRENEGSDEPIVLLDAQLLGDTAIAVLWAIDFDTSIAIVGRDGHIRSFETKVCAGLEDQCGWDQRDSLESMDAHKEEDGYRLSFQCKKLLCLPDVVLDASPKIVSWKHP
jgi:hypothetical protein